MIDELLCFTINKRGRLAEQFLKSILYNLYEMEHTSLAKVKLVDAVESLGLDKWPSK